MKTLNEYNDYISKVNKDLQDRRAYVLCNHCWTEMVYVPMPDAALNPYRENRLVECPECGEEGVKCGVMDKQRFLQEYIIPPRKSFPIDN